MNKIFYEEKIIKLYSEGNSIRQIRDITGVSYGKVWSVCNDAGVLHKRAHKESQANDNKNNVPTNSHKKTHKPLLQDSLPANDGIPAKFKKRNEMLVVRVKNTNTKEVASSQSQPDMSARSIVKCAKKTVEKENKKTQLLDTQRPSKKIFGHGRQHVIKMFKQKFPVYEIAQTTGFTKEQIEEILAEYHCKEAFLNKEYGVGKWKILPYNEVKELLLREIVSPEIRTHVKSIKDSTFPSVDAEWYADEQDAAINDVKTQYGKSATTMNI